MWLKRVEKSGVQENRERGWRRSNKRNKLNIDVVKGIHKIENLNNNIFDVNSKKNAK